jgi:hypothetical protein
MNVFRWASKHVSHVDDTFVVWPHDTEKLKEFLSHINSLRPTIQFTLETETGDSLPFLDVLVYRNGTSLLTKVYRKPTHTGRYLHLNSNHPPHVKRGVVHSLINRAIALCTEKQEYAKEVVKIRKDLATNWYPQHIINSVLKRSVAKS